MVGSCGTKGIFLRDKGIWNHPCNEGCLIGKSLSIGCGKDFVTFITFIWLAFETFYMCYFLAIFEAFVPTSSWNALSIFVLRPRRRRGCSRTRSRDSICWMILLGFSKEEVLSADHDWRQFLKPFRESQTRPHYIIHRNRIRERRLMGVTSSAPSHHSQQRRKKVLGCVRRNSCAMPCRYTLKVEANLGEIETFLPRVPG